MRNSYSGALSARGGVVRALYGRAADPDSPRPTRPREDAFAALMSGGKRARTAEREKVSVPLSALMPCGRAPKDHKGDSAGLLRELWMGQRSGWGTGATSEGAVFSRRAQLETPPQWIHIIPVHHCKPRRRPRRRLKLTQSTSTSTRPIF